MFQIEEYMQELIASLKNTFKEKLQYVGLQGSYMRGEANENSDIDVVVILSELNIDDLNMYKNLIRETVYPEKSCGFICGKKEMANWNPMEICHLVHSTEDYYGTLSELVPKYNEQDVINFIKLSVNNLYHEICHRYIHSDINKNKQRIAGAYKNVFFILQNVYLLKIGAFVKTKKELYKELVGIDAEVMKMASELEKNVEYNFEEAFELLLKWCQGIIGEEF